MKIVVPMVVMPACAGPSLKTPSLPSPKLTSAPGLPPTASAAVIWPAVGSQRPVLEPSRY
jgi:hypothetical protein